MPITEFIRDTLKRYKKTSFPIVISRHNRISIRSNWRTRTGTRRASIYHQSERYEMTEFKQPVMQDTTDPNAVLTQQMLQTQAPEVMFDVMETGAPADNTDKTDELSVAVAEAEKPKPVEPEPVKPAGPGRFRLRYYLHGKRIIETHETVQRAVARVADLRRMGITPETATAPAPTATAPAPKA
jgi:hypothetical protein